MDNTKTQKNNKIFFIVWLSFGIGIGAQSLCIGRYLFKFLNIQDIYLTIFGPYNTRLPQCRDGLINSWTRYTYHDVDIIYNNSYSPHLARGIVDGMPFDNFGASWAPNGDRSVFDRSVLWVEPLPQQAETANLPLNTKFH
ncbi:MAG: hypothetical protein ACPGVT_01300 [Maricaulaceae bacterium]